MSSFFTLTLDTTAPQITWGLPSSTQRDTTLVLPYSINEPDIDWVQLRDSANTITAATFDGTSVTVNIPDDAVLGTAWIEAQVTDELDNTALRQYQFTITPFGVVISPGPGGGGQRFTYGAGAPAWLKETISIEAEVSLLRFKKVSLNGYVELRRKSTVNLSGNVNLLRSNSVQLNCTREPADHYLRLCREDEEILLLL